MDKLIAWFEKSGLKPDDLTDEEIVNYAYSIGLQFGISSSDVDKAIKKYTKDYNDKLNKRYSEYKKQKVDQQKRQEQGKAWKIKKDANKRDGHDRAIKIAIERKKKEEDAAKNAKLKNYAEEDRQIKLSRIREDSNTKSISGIAKALGIPIPDKLFNDAKEYTRASEDTDRIKKRAADDQRELTEEEQKKLDSLEEVMTRTKGANDLLEKFGFDITSIGLTATVTITTLELLKKAFDAAIDAGKRASDRIDGVQTSMSSFGTVLNDANTKTNELEKGISTSMSNIGKYWDAMFSDFYNTVLLIEDAGLNILEGLLGGVSWVRDAIGDWADISGSGSTYGDTGINSYENDTYFQDYIRGLNSKGYGEMFTQEQFYNIFGAAADSMLPAGNDLNSISLVAQSLLSSYFNSDRFSLDIASGYDTVESAKEIFDILSNGGVNTRLGLNLSDTYMTGYKAMMGIAPGMELTEAMEQELRFMAIQEQLSESNRDAWAEKTQAVMEYGYAIEDATGKLFSFDQAEVLGSRSTNIPGLDDWINAMDGNKGAILESIEDIPDQFGKSGQESAKKWGDSLNAGVDNTLGILRNKIQGFSKDVAGYINTIGTGSIMQVKYSGSYDRKLYPMLTLGNSDVASNLRSIEEKYNINKIKAWDTSVITDGGLNKFATSTNTGNTYNIEVNLDGINIAENERVWNEMAYKLRDVLALREQRGG